MRLVPSGIRRPPYAATGDPGRPPRKDRPLSPQEIKRMRRAGAIAGDVLTETAAALTIGVTTDELDRVCHDAAIARGAYPSPLNYRGFPKSLCTSINHVICHGIPGTEVVRDGDIVNLDVTVYMDGFHGDVNQTFLIGDVPAAVRSLVSATEAAMYAGIDAVRPGRQIRAIGSAIERSVGGRYGIVREFGGHGIGERFHSGLFVPHYDEPTATTVLKPGMTFTIEPMLTLGSPELRILADQWTVVTVDGKPSAQFEHTVLVTGKGAEVLTTHAAMGAVA